MAGHQQLQKRRNRAPEAGIVRPDHPSVLPTPARDGGSETYTNLATFQTFSQNHPPSPPPCGGDSEKKSEKLRDLCMSRCPHRVRVWGARWDGRESVQPASGARFPRFGSMSGPAIGCSPYGRRAGGAVSFSEKIVRAFKAAFVSLRRRLWRPRAVLWRSSPIKYRYDMA